MKTFIAFGATLILAVSPPVLVQAATTIDATHRYAYGANLGWLDWRGDTTHGVVIGAYVCSGYLYAANVGWINLGNGSPINSITRTFRPMTLASTTTAWVTSAATPMEPISAG